MSISFWLFLQLQIHDCQMDEKLRAKDQENTLKEQVQTSAPGGSCSLDFAGDTQAPQTLLWCLMTFS